MGNELRTIRNNYGRNRRNGHFGPLGLKYITVFRLSCRGRPPAREGGLGGGTRGPRTATFDRFRAPAGVGRPGGPGGSFVWGMNYEPFGIITNEIAETAVSAYRI